MPADERQQRPAHLTDSGWLALLSAGEIKIEGRLPWSSNYSFLATVSDAGSPPARAVYKPGSGERPLWDFGTELFRREVAAYELSATFGLRLVPETVLRLDGPLGAGSLQRFVEADFEQHYFTLLDDDRFHERLRELAGFDVLCNNADRKGGHVLVDEQGQIWGIDNGLSFHVDDKLRTVIWDFAGELVAEPIIDACQSIADRGVPPRVAALIGEPEALALVKRAKALLRSRRLPAPRDDHRAYPWPLV
ncbi:MAG: SCO1664 family protein [Acidimicrobiales bacterium]